MHTRQADGDLFIRGNKTAVQQGICAQRFGQLHLDRQRAVFVAAQMLGADAEFDRSVWEVSGKNLFITDKDLAAFDPGLKKLGCSMLLSPWVVFYQGRTASAMP